MATLLDLVLKASLLMIVATVIIALMRRASAASRHVALTAALGAAVLLPAARWALPALPLFVLAAESQPVPAPPSPPTEAFAPVAAPIVFADPNTIGSVDQPVRSAPPPEFVRASSWSWPRVLGMLWLLGSAALLVRMTVSGIRIRSLTSDAQPIDDVRIAERLLEIKEQFGVARPVTLVVSPREWMPITWGLRRPAILLPSCATTWMDLHPARLDAVLVHEVAHIARWDAAWQGVARMAVACFWFNPLVWIAARRARLERERACDDAVLARGLRATDYASDLILLAQTLVLPSRAAGSALAIARQSQLELRVGALLDGRISRRSASGVSQLVAIALIALMLPVSAAQLAARPVTDSEPTLDSGAAPAVEPAVTPVTVESQPVVSPSALPPVVGASVMNRAPTPGGPLPVVEPQAPSTPLLSQQAKWQLERDAMLRLLTSRARNLVKDGRTKIEIGTAAPIDLKPLEDALALMERAAGVNGSDWRFGASATTSFIAVNLPTDDQIADAKKRFTDASRNLDAVEVRWENGLITSQEVSTALTETLKVLTEDPTAAPVPIRFVTRSGPNTTSMSDATLLQMLKDIASIKGDTERAGMLLDLSARYAFTPEMVTLYVAAAKGMASAAEQARVFAQPIRVK